MKYPLIVLFLYASLVSHARYDITVGMGLSRNSPLVLQGYKNIGSPHASYLPCFSVKADYNTRLWQVGIASGLSSFSGRYVANSFMFPNLFDGPLTEEEKELQAWANFNATNPRYNFIYAPILSFVNIKAHIRQVVVYGGVAAGANTIVSRAADDYGSIKAENDLRINGALGVQAGVSVPIASRFAFNAELAARYIFFSGRVHFVTVPLTAGVTYSL